MKKELEIRTKRFALDLIQFATGCDGLRREAEELLAIFVSSGARLSRTAEFFPFRNPHSGNPQCL
jgi:hypothetical protein